MSNFASFMKANKKEKKNVFFPATKSLCDKDGNPLLWELRAVPTKLNDKIRDDCTIEVQVKGKVGQYRQKIDTGLYMEKLMVASIVSPDLNDADLQNSYGVMTPEDLLKEMIDDAGEYTDLSVEVQKLCGFTALSEDVEEAKN